MTETSAHPLAGIEPVEVDKSASSRRITTEWLLGTDGNGYTTVLQVSTNHFGKAEYVGRPDKVMRASVGYCKRQIGEQFTREKFGVYTQAGGLFTSEPAARYNAGKLRAHHDAAVAEFLADPERFEAVITEAQNAHLSDD